LTAAADVAAEEAELDVLRGNMPLPFVLGSKSACAAVVREAADEDVALGRQLDGLLILD
jgi:hypothetical protein